MNRPFYAFGVLLALLALAMIAVSSTNRTTSVRARPADAAGTQLSPRSRPGGIYVVVLPAGDEPSADAPHCPLPACPLNPACIRAAEYDAASQAEPNGCWSHYDPAYDSLVYGACAPATETPVSGLAKAGDCDDLMAIFQSLGVPSAPAVRRIGDDSRRLGSALRPWLLGLRNRSLALAERLGWQAENSVSTEPISWADYQDLMAAIESQSAAHDTVRSGGWLLHFAVSSWSHWGQTLRQFAAELQHGESGAENSSVGGSSD